MPCISALTDEEFSTLIYESMIKQARPVTMLDPRRNRWNIATGDFGLYIGLFQVKGDDCACTCQDEPEHCSDCIPTERGLTVNYKPTDQDLAQVAGLSSPA